MPSRSAEANSRFQALARGTFETFKNKRAPDGRAVTLLRGEGLDVSYRRTA